MVPTPASLVVSPLNQTIYVTLCTGEAADAITVWLSTEFCDCIHNAGGFASDTPRWHATLLTFCFPPESAAKAKDASDGTSAAAAGICLTLQPLVCLAFFDLQSTAAVEMKTDRLDLALDFCQAVCDSAAVPIVQALVVKISTDFLKRTAFQPPLQQPSKCVSRLHLFANSFR